MKNNKIINIYNEILKTIIIDINIDFLSPVYDIKIYKYDDIKLIKYMSTKLIDHNKSIKQIIYEKYNNELIDNFDDFYQLNYKKVNECMIKNNIYYNELLPINNYFKNMLEMIHDKYFVMNDIYYDIESKLNNFYHFRFNKFNDDIYILSDENIDIINIFISNVKLCLDWFRSIYYDNNNIKNKLTLYIYRSNIEKKIFIYKYLGFNSNSGLSYCTFDKNNRYMMIWRKEEFFKVLIHELIHYYDIDLKYHKLEFENKFKLGNNNYDIIINEGIVETYTCILNTLFNIYYNNKTYDKKLIKKNLQIEYIHNFIQIIKIFKFYNISKFQDLYNDNDFNQYSNVFSYYIIKLFYYDYLLKNCNINYILDLISYYDYIKNIIYTLFDNHNLIDNINQITKYIRINELHDDILYNFKMCIIEL